MRVVRYAIAGWGLGELVYVDGCLVDHEGPSHRRRGEPDSASREEQALIDLIDAYFAGERAALQGFNVEHAIDHMGASDFERRVFRSVCAVPPGETRSYGEIAVDAGVPRAARAVGSAMARGPLELFIPYHRIIRADGSLGGYGSDPDRRARLLALEAGR